MSTPTPAAQAHRPEGTPDIRVDIRADVSTDIRTETRALPRPCPRAVHYDAQRYAHPRTQREALERALLEHVNRHRLLRALDLAAALAPERRFDAAMSTVQRQLARLVSERLVQRRIVAHHTVYALTQRGAHRLEALRGDDPGAPPAPWSTWPAVRSSARRVADRSNPEHSLLIAQTVIGAEARGLPAWSEAELRAGLKTPPLLVEVEGSRRGLWPDALVLLASAAGPQLVWVEIDRSRRGSRRLADLAALVRAAGAAVRVPSADGGQRAVPLRRIVVLCRHAAIARANLSYLLPRVTVGCTGEPALVRSAAGLYDVRIELDQCLADGRVQRVRQVGARLLIAPWTHPQPGAWFDSGALPWALPAGTWPAPRPLAFAPQGN